MVHVKSKQAFKDSVLSGEDEIRVDDPELAKWIVIIHGIKQFAWSCAIIMVAAGIYSLLSSAGTAAPATVGFTAVSTGIVGLSGFSAMIGLGMVFGGVAGLKILRSDYKIIEKGTDFVILKHK